MVSYLIFVGKQRYYFTNYRLGQTLYYANISYSLYEKPKVHWDFFHGYLLNKKEHVISYFHRVSFSCIYFRVIRDKVEPHVPLYPKLLTEFYTAATGVLAL